MKAAIYLKEVKQANLLAVVDLEVVPRGIYEIDGKPYEYTGQPKFIIATGNRGDNDKLERVELIVEEYVPNKPKVFRSPA